MKKNLLLVIVLGLLITSCESVPGGYFPTGFPFSDWYIISRGDYMVRPMSCHGTITRVKVPTKINITANTSGILCTKQQYDEWGSTYHFRVEGPANYIQQGSYISVDLNPGEYWFGVINSSQQTLAYSWKIEGITLSTLTASRTTSPYSQTATPSQRQSSSNTNPNCGGWVSKRTGTMTDQECAQFQTDVHSCADQTDIPFGWGFMSSDQIIQGAIRDQNQCLSNTGWVGQP